MGEDNSPTFGSQQPNGQDNSQGHPLAVVAQGNNTYYVRLLTEKDAAIYAEIRLEALKKHQHFFGPDTYEKRVDDILDDWVKFVRATEDSCHFGLFNQDDELIGISSIYPYNVKKLFPGDQLTTIQAQLASADTTHNPRIFSKLTDGDTAVWGSTYIKPAYRGLKLAHLLNEKRVKWTEAHPRYKFAVQYIAQGNTESRGIHERHNRARYIATIKVRWEGREPSNWRFYYTPIKENDLLLGVDPDTGAGRPGLLAPPVGRDLKKSNP